LILQGGIYSRFYVDPKVGRERYERLHKLWMNNSVRDNTIFITKKNNYIIGFVSLNEKNERGNIDFIVVDKKHRGKGLATALMIYAHNWFFSKGCANVQADTQENNINACNMYNKLGYKQEKIQKFYHFWL
jgi:ribosomal protein S18 acetylase RimI-like enzyme